MLKKRFETQNLSIRFLDLYFIFYKYQKDKKRNYKYTKVILPLLLILNKNIKAILL